MTLIGQINQMIDDPPQDTLPLVGGNLVTWRCKKMNVVALSSDVAIFQGIAKWIIEFLWIKKLLSEIGFPLNVLT